uniref:Uncharacterized protein n=1 Tax=Aegilops tauschii subsp. strangulata TaxID=200361 RepID=A0A453L9X8_AEGTS
RSEYLAGSRLKVRLQRTEENPASGTHSRTQVRLISPVPPHPVSLNLPRIIALQMITWSFNIHRLLCRWSHC